MLASACGCSGSLCGKWAASDRQNPEHYWSLSGSILACLPSKFTQSKLHLTRNEEPFRLLAWSLPLAAGTRVRCPGGTSRNAPPPAGEPDARGPFFRIGTRANPPTKCRFPRCRTIRQCKPCAGITLYLDYTYEISNDLSTFYWVKGHALAIALHLAGTFTWAACTERRAAGTVHPALHR